MSPKNTLRPALASSKMMLWSSRGHLQCWQIFLQFTCKSWLSIHDQNKKWWQFKQNEREKIKIDSLWLLCFEVVFCKCTFNIKTVIKTLALLPYLSKLQVCNSVQALRRLSLNVIFWKFILIKIEATNIDIEMSINLRLPAQQLFAN